MHYTVGQARSLISPHVGESGKCPDSPTVLAALNEARRILWKLGDWEGTLLHVVSAAVDRVCALPATIEVVKNAYTTNINRTLVNGWYETLPTCPSRSSLIGDCSTGITDLGDRFVTAVQPTEDFTLGILMESEKDRDVQLIFEGENEHGYYETAELSVPIEHQIRWSDNLFSKLHSVVKPVTNGRVRLYARYQDQTEELIGIYNPYDVNPRFRILRIGRGRKDSVVYVKGKKRYFDLTRDEEFVDLDIDALIEALHAIAARKAREFEKEALFIRGAVGLLQKQIVSRTPNDGGKIHFTPSFNKSENVVDCW